MFIKLSTSLNGTSSREIMLNIDNIVKIEKSNKQHNKSVIFTNAPIGNDVYIIEVEQTFEELIDFISKSPD